MCFLCAVADLNKLFGKLTFTCVERFGANANVLGTIVAIATAIVGRTVHFMIAAINVIVCNLLLAVARLFFPSPVPRPPHLILTFITQIISQIFDSTLILNT